MVNGIYERGARTVDVAVAIGCRREVVVIGAGTQPRPDCRHAGQKLRNKFPALSFPSTPKLMSVPPSSLPQLDISGQGNLLILPIEVSLLGYGASRKA